MSRVRPILFNTDMVEAILEGRKTVTRRVVKYKYSNTVMEMFTNKYGTRLIEIQKNVEGETYGKHPDGRTWHKIRPYIEKKAPYKRGDILYVRETWSFMSCIDCPDYGCYAKLPVIHEDRDAVSEGCYIYRAGHENPERITWRPSIHMPKAAARIWLKVKDVRAERLQDMNASDLKAEGFLRYNLEDFKSEFDKFAVKFGYEEAKKRFVALWNSTIPDGQQDSYGWDANPWVWTIEFEQCRKPESEG